MIGDALNDIGEFLAIFSVCDTQRGCLWRCWENVHASQCSGQGLMLRVLKLNDLHSSHFWWFRFLDFLPPPNGLKIGLLTLGLMFFFVSFWIKGTKCDSSFVTGPCSIGEHTWTVYTTRDFCLSFQLKTWKWWKMEPNHFLQEFSAILNQKWPNTWKPNPRKKVLTIIVKRFHCFQVYSYKACRSQSFRKGDSFSPACSKGLFIFCPKCSNTELKWKKINTT